MPELAEDMYCSQQICIPPSFPYLLRQYAKAAIRTQPGDLLRWSTAYFRCLALNVPPPVKPRLEYPIPKAHFGLTPGWLKALMYQLQNNLTVSFKILWDRWIGACLQHKNLIQVLCLGGFNDPFAIPWYRFVALCAAHLTHNLTQTMILVCEILTEEPEGGSSIIPLEVFTDLYRFLADIDASEPQNRRNICFIDSLLSLYREPVVEEVKESTIEIEEEVEEEIVEVEEEKVVVVVKGPVEDLVGVVISCPDIAADDYKTEDDFDLQEPLQESIKEKQSQLTGPKGDEKAAPSIAESKSVSKKESAPQTPKPAAPSRAEEGEEKEIPAKPSAVSGEKPPGSTDTLVGYMPERQRDKELLEDLQKVKDAQEEGYDEVAGEEEEEEVDYELEKLKLLLEGPPCTGVIESEISVSVESEEKRGEEEEEVEEEEEPKGELIYIDAVPGIGPMVSLVLVEVVEKYMKECSRVQHGMVMPRNIRHYNCPPLEALKK